MILPATGRNDRGKLILSDLRIVMKELTPEELEKRLFRNLHSWRSNDYIIRYEGEEYPTDEDQLECLRKNYGLEKSEMTDLFVKAIQDYLSGKETNPENQTLQDRRRFVEAIYDLEYYPPPQQQFLELIRKVVELEPESADTLILSYTKAYPDWVFDDGTILELTCKSDMEEFNLREAGSDLRKQVRQEKDEVRRCSYGAIWSVGFCSAPALRQSNTFTPIKSRNLSNQRGTTQAHRTLWIQEDCTCTTLDNNPSSNIMSVAGYYESDLKHVDLMKRLLMYGVGSSTSDNRGDISLGNVFGINKSKHFVNVKTGLENMNRTPTHYITNPPSNF